MNNAKNALKLLVVALHIVPMKARNKKKKNGAAWVNLKAENSKTYTQA